MNAHHRRGVTRGYVAGLVFAVVIVALALMIVGWSAISLFAHREVVSTPGIAVATVPLTVLALLALLAISLWQQSVMLLRSKRGPAWAHIVLIATGSYLLWCVFGLFAGLSIEDTWISPYALVIALAWAAVSVLCWAVLARRVYTDRPTPQWPWERKGEPGPDWTTIDDLGWGDRGDEDGADNGPEGGGEPR